MAVPEASMDEYGEFRTAENDVWLARQTPDILAVSQATCEEAFP